MGANLVSIASEYEQGLVARLIITELFESYWLGMTERVKERQWQWTDGSPMSYQNWDWGQPENFDDNIGGIDEDCTMIMAKTGKWHDELCSKKRAFICEKRRDKE
jgi:C-type mannose receptor